MAHENPHADKYRGPTGWALFGLTVLVLVLLAVAYDLSHEKLPLMRAEGFCEHHEGVKIFVAWDNKHTVLCGDGQRVDYR
jgi:hypothetical protein